MSSYPGYGSGCRSIALTMAKSAVGAAMPSESVMMAAAAKEGWCRRRRQATENSRMAGSVSRSGVDAQRFGWLDAHRATHRRGARGHGDQYDERSDGRRGDYRDEEPGPEPGVHVLSE